MRIPVLLSLLVLAVGCDTAEPDVAPAGWIEGTYTLPDGATARFRTPARAQGYDLGRGSSPQRFGFGGSPPYPVEEPGAVVVSVNFTQYNDRMTPAPGRYLMPYGATSEPSIDGTIVITNVPGLSARDLLDPSTAIVDFPEGEMTMTLRSPDVIQGTFAMRGQPFGTDSTTRVAVEGTFEIPVSPPSR